MRRALSIVAAAAAALASAALAAPTDHTIQADVALGGVTTKTSPRLATLAAAFGAPSSARKVGPSDCRVVWRDRGLVVGLLDLGYTGDPCRNGGYAIGTATGRAWHTLGGLRVGDPVSRLRALYPHARLHLHEDVNSGWWLVPRRSCKETGSNPYPGLLARTIRGRVSALVQQIGVCE